MMNKFMHSKQNKNIVGLNIFFIIFLNDIRVLHPVNTN